MREIGREGGRDGGRDGGREGGTEGGGREGVKEGERVNAVPNESQTTITTASDDITNLVLVDGCL